MINILYEDNHIIIVEKKVGILSQEDYTKDKDMLNITKQYIKEKYQKPSNVYLGLVHRLDRMVGGIMIFAKTSKAARRISEQIKNKQFQKYYLAIVNGKLEDGILKDNLKKIKNKSIVSKDGKESILEYKVLEYNKKLNASLVKIKLITGRHHQIRVQFSSRNHYLLGDHKYGKGDKNIALYAYKIKFYHPTKKEELTFKLLPNKNKDYWKYFSIKENI